MSNKNEKTQLTREQKHQKEVEAYLVIDAILDQVKDFRAEEKIGDFVHIANTIKMYKMSPKDCKRIWEKFRQKMRNNSKKENDYFRRFRLDLQEYYWSEFKENYKSRLEIYEEHIANSLHPYFIDLKEKEESVSHLLSVYSQYATSNEKNKKDFHKKLETTLSSEIQSKHTQYEENINAIEIYNQMCTSSAFRDNKSRKIAEECFTDYERVSLLKGILQYGENDFNLIYEKYQFQPFRSISSLALEWRRIKFVMLEEISTMKEKGHNINKCEWLLACIKKCENQGDAKDKNRVMQQWRMKRIDQKDTMNLMHVQQEEDLLNLIKRDYNELLSLASDYINKGSFDITLLGKSNHPPALHENLIRSKISQSKIEGPIDSYSCKESNPKGPINYKKLFHEVMYPHT